MMRWMAKNRVNMIRFIVLVFLLGTFAGFGGYVWMKSDGDPAFLVNGEKISIRQLKNHTRELETYSKDSTSSSPPTAAQWTARAGQSLTQLSAFSQEAKRWGLDVSDAEVAFYIQSMPGFQQDGKFDGMLYNQTLRQRLGVRPQDFETLRRQELMAQKMQWTLIDQVYIPTAEMAWRIKQARAHLPPSDKTPDSKIQESVRQDEVRAVLRRTYEDISRKTKIKNLLPTSAQDSPAAG